jgi:protocatechuate 3,4-dioxygenase beta subunit
MPPALFVLALSLLQTPQKGKPPVEPGAQTATIEGRVLKAGTDEPLKKAWVTLYKLQGEQRPGGTSTDSSGRFTLKGIEPGRYQLWAQRNGYVQQAYGQRGSERSGTTLTLSPGQTLSDIVFRLFPAAVISGRVFDEDGEPVAGAIVQAMRYRYTEGKRDLLPAGRERSDDLGEYRIYGLAAGQYYVSANFMPGRGAAPAALAGTVGEKGEETYPPTYYPGTDDPARATPLELRAGEEVGGIDIGFLPTRAVRVRGRVFNAVTGQPGRGVMVELSPRESGVRRFISRHEDYVEDAQGAFEIAGVTPGSYLLEAHWWSDGKDYTTRLPVEVGTSDLEGLNVVISPGVSLSGRVRVEGDRKIALADLNVFLMEFEESVMGGGSQASVKADGTFLLANVPEGEYRINLWRMPEDCYLKSARWGSEDVLEAPLKIGSGQAGGSLDLVLSTAAGRIEGSVWAESQQPVPGGRVVLVPDPPRRGQLHLYEETTTDQYGQFILRGITPGDYKVFAWEEVESGAYHDPEFLKPYEERGEAVKVAEGGQQVVRLTLIPSEKSRP